MRYFWHNEPIPNPVDEIFYTFIIFSIIWQTSVWVSFNKEENICFGLIFKTRGIITYVILKKCGLHTCVLSVFLIESYSNNTREETYEDDLSSTFFELYKRYWCQKMLYRNCMFLFAYFLLFWENAKSFYIRFLVQFTPNIYSNLSPN